MRCATNPLKTSSFAGASRHLGIIKIEPQVLVDNVLSSYVVAKANWHLFLFMARCIRAGQLRARQARAEKYLWSFSLTSPNSGSSKILCNKYFQTSDSVHYFLRQIATKTPFYRNYAHNLNLKTTAWENHTGQIFANYFTWLSILERGFSTCRRGGSALWADWRYPKCLSKINI